MKIQYNICVKWLKLFLIGERTLLTNSRIDNSCYYPAIIITTLGKTPLPNSSMLILVTIPLFQFLPFEKTPLPNSSMVIFCY